MKTYVAKIACLPGGGFPLRYENVRFCANIRTQASQTCFFYEHEQYQTAEISKSVTLQKNIADS